MSAESLEMRGNLSNVEARENISQLELYLDFAFSIASCMVLLFTLCVGIAANLFVIWAVYHQKSLQTSNNALLVNLAIADLLRCSIDCPLLLAVVLGFPKHGDLGIPLCYTQTVCFSFSCFVQLITVASISAERYQAIAYPFKTSQRRKRIKVWIPLTWTISIPLSVLSATLVDDNPVYIKCRGSPTAHLSSYNSFGLYIVVPLWSGCLFAIIGFYGRIFLLVRAHSRKIFDKGVSLPNKKNKKVITDAKESNDKKPVEKCEKPQDVPRGGTQAEERVEQSAAEASQDLLKTSVPANTTLASHEELDCRDTAEISIPKDDTQPGSLFLLQEIKESTLDEAGLNFSAPGDTSVVSDFVEITPAKPTDDVNNETVEAESLPLNETAPDAEEQVARDLEEMDAAIASATEPVNNAHDDTVEVANFVVKETAPDAEEPAVSDLVEMEAAATKRVDNANNETAEAADLAGKETTPDEAVSAPPAVTDQAEEVAGAVCMMPSFADRERVNKNKESKLAKRSGYIILTFLLFWIPLILSVLVNFFAESHRSSDMAVVVAVDIFSISIACITSASNPVTYAVVNPQFRSEFRSLRSKCKAAMCHKY